MDSMEVECLQERIQQLHSLGEHIIVITDRDKMGKVGPHDLYKMTAYRILPLARDRSLLSETQVRSRNGRPKARQLTKGTQPDLRRQPVPRHAGRNAWSRWFLFLADLSHDTHASTTSQFETGRERHVGNGWFRCPARCGRQLSNFISLVRRTTVSSSTEAFKRD